MSLAQRSHRNSFFSQCLHDPMTTRPLFPYAFLHASRFYRSVLGRQTSRTQSFFMTLVLWPLRAWSGFSPNCATHFTSGTAE